MACIKGVPQCLVDRMTSREVTVARALIARVKKARTSVGIANAMNDAATYGRSVEDAVVSYVNRN